MTLDATDAGFLDPRPDLVKPQSLTVDGGLAPTGLGASCG